MITVKNYQDQKSTIDWGTMPKAIQDTRNDVEEIMEFYDDDADIKETVDIFLNQINDNSKPVGEIIVAKVPKVLHNPNVKKETFEKAKKAVANVKPAKVKQSDNAKKLGQLLYEYANLSNRMVKVVSGAKNIAETQTYDQLNDKLQKTVTEISYLIDGKYSEALEYIKEWVSKNGSLFVFDEKKYLEAAKQAYNIDKKPEAKTPAKTKVAKVIDKTIVDNLSPEFMLIRRFWNIIKTETVHVPFRTVQLLYMAFNKAAVERKVRKVSEAAELFTACNKKIITLFDDIPNDDKEPYEIEFTDKKLYNEIKEYVSDVAVNPAIPLLKRFIAIQNTKPEIKKAETLLKSMEKIYVDEKPNRLKVELNSAISELQDYIKKPSQEIEPTIYGLSVPKVCKNRVKCSGLTQNGQLKKGYRFEEDSNNVIKVVKGLGSPKVCHNRVKCAGLTQNGQLKKGYKFREDTNEVIRVTKAPAKRKPAVKKATAKKKVVVGLGFSDKFQEVERIYVNNPIVPITNSTMPAVAQEVTPTLAQPAPQEVETIPVVKNKLMQMQFDSLDMDEGWENFMQNPARNMRMAIWGAPKNGKTAGSLQMANYLTKFGRVLYNFADQGFNKSTQDLWLSSGLAKNPKAEPSDVQTLAELEKEVATGKYAFVFIDMISDYINKEKITPSEFKERFMKKYPKVSFILVFEVTKEGNFKGDQGWTHIVDAIVTVKDFFMENRGRYGMGYHIVWEDGFKRFNLARYEEVQNELQPQPQNSFAEVQRI